MSDKTTDPMAEIDAMKTVAEALSTLDEASCSRILRWAADRFGVEIQAVPQQIVTNGQTQSDNHIEGTPRTQDFSDIADLFATIDPSSDPEKALVISYWFQVIENQSDFDSQSVNKELKNLGHGASNITSAMNSLIGRKPALVMQTKKSGTSQQARKKYKLTHEGVKKAEEMMYN